jgi:hypothetical protein
MQPPHRAIARILPAFSFAASIVSKLRKLTAIQDYPLSLAPDSVAARF